MANPTVGAAQARYEKLKSEREPFLRRGRDCAELSLPHLLPPEGHTATMKMKTPFQGIGAEGVNNLASKLLIALLPPNSPFFRLRVDDMMMEEQQDEEWKTEVEKALGKVERTVMSDIESSSDRVVLFEALKHLMVAGNVLLYDDMEGLRAFHLDRYVCRRDPMGNPLEMVVKEIVSPDALPKDFYKKIKSKLKNSKGDDGYKDISLFTHIKRENDKWSIYQECMGRKIPGTYGTYPLDACPWLPLRLNRIEGEDYGRSYVEEILGDLKSLEALTQAIVEGSAAAAKILILVNPNGTTRAKTITNAPNGAVREGNADDVTMLQMDKAHDFRVALETSRMIQERLSRAFLLMQGVQRDAERVTAEEVRLTAHELESRLGGVYSILTQEFQLPYVHRKMAKLTKKGKLPHLPKELVKPSIVTGMEALGRGHDRQKLMGFLGTLGQTLGPEVIQQYVNLDDAIARLATADGIDTDGLIKTKEEIAQAAQQSQMQAMMSQFGPELLKQFGPSMAGGMNLPGGNTDGS